MNTWSRTRWVKEIYLALLPAGPLGYLLYHTERDVSFLSRFYGRLDVEVPDHLLELVESEVDLLSDLKKAKMKISLTDKLNGRVFGLFSLNAGAELQLPLRVALRDIDDAKKIGCILDVDAGTKKLARAFDMNDKNGSLLLSRMRLSEQARRYAIHRELLSAQSGSRFVMPVLFWIAGFGFGYFVLMAAGPFIGSLASLFVASTFGLLLFYKANSVYSVFLTRNLDLKACMGSDTYIKGAEDYFSSSMKLCRAIRRLTGDADGCITESGDCTTDPIPYSERLKAVKQLAEK